MKIPLTSKTHRNLKYGTIVCGCCSDNKYRVLSGDPYIVEVIEANGIGVLGKLGTAWVYNERKGNLGYFESFDRDLIDE